MGNKKKLTKQEIQQRRLQVGVIALTALCFAAIAVVAILNRQPPVNRYTYTTENDIWYVSDADMAIAAPEGEESQTPPPTAVPTPEPTPTVEPTPTSEPEPTPVTITITAAGDVTLGYYKKGSGVSNFKSAVDNMGYDYFLQNFRELFSQDDLTIVNLEGPLTGSTEKRPNRPFNFRGDPDYVNILTSASVEICNLANNHALDYMQAGFMDTCRTLDEAGIGYSGYGTEYYTEINGRTVGSLGFTEWDFKEADILKAVTEAKQNCDLLIVSMHWGDEGGSTFTKYSANMGMKLVDAGADLVIGNHPHVTGSITKYHGKYIIHSLGNFCFGGNDKQSSKVRKCAVFRQQFVVQPDGSVEDGGIDIIPAFTSGETSYNNFQPVIADVDDGAAILSEIIQKHSAKTLNLDDVLWLDDSYVYQNGILENPRQDIAYATNR